MKILILYLQIWVKEANDRYVVRALPGNKQQRQCPRVGKRRLGALKHDILFG